MNILLTGGAGFIGSNLVKYLLEVHSDIRIVNLDKLTYAGNLDNLDSLKDDPRHNFEQGDICDGRKVAGLLRKHSIEAVINVAAETHVDRSILDSSEFIRTNVVGTDALLETSKEWGVARFIQVSTDEVYGSLGSAGSFVETMPLNPTSPYAASKASADFLVQSYHRTYGFPALITRCCNNFGPYQFPEKLIPLMIVNALNDAPLPVYGDGLNTRDWLYVRDFCSALDLVLHEGRVGEVYNVGGGNERTNLSVVKMILEILKKPDSLLAFVGDRPAHDRRYAVNSFKLQRDLGWAPTVTFEEGLQKTVQWYIENPDWWRKVTGGDFKVYYRRMYANR